MHKKLFLLAIEESEGSIYIYFKSAKFRMVINYSQSKARRMTRLKLTLPSWLWHLEIELSERNSLYFTWPAQSRYSSRLRWRALPASEAALAADGAAGVPVRRPRRPTAVSAVVAADAAPQLGVSASSTSHADHDLAR
jgi:hypothetical protein